MRPSATSVCGLKLRGAHRLTREIQKIKTEAKSAVEEAQRELVSIKQVCGVKLLVYEALSISVCGLKLLVYAALSHQCMGPSATSV
jgi:hypothetical protein